MSIHRAANCVNGRLCKAFANIDGLVEELLWIKTFEATVEKSKTEVNVMGDLWTQHKAGGLSGSGSMTIYSCTPVFKKLMQDYEKTKIDHYITLTIVNADPGSNAGTQSVILTDVNFNSTNVTKIDVEADVLEEDMDFTFSGWDFPSHYKENLE